MADPPSDAAGPQDEEPMPPAPRWVKALGWVVLALAVVFVAVHLMGGGMQGHGP